MEFSNTYSELTSTQFLKVPNLFPAHFWSTFRIYQNSLTGNFLKFFFRISQTSHILEDGFIYL